MSIREELLDRICWFWANLKCCAYEVDVRALVQDIGLSTATYGLSVQAEYNM